MTRNDKDTITRRTENRHLLRRMKAGLMAARDTPHKGLLLTAYLAGAVLVWLFRGHLFGLDAYHEVEALARILLPEIQAFFESEEGQREYAEWKARHQAEQENKT